MIRSMNTKRTLLAVLVLALPALAFGTAKADPCPWCASAATAPTTMSTPAPTGN